MIYLWLLMGWLAAYTAGYGIYYYNTDEFRKSYFCSLFWMLVAIFLMSTMVISQQVKPDCEYRDVKENIVLLTDNSEVSGSMHGGIFYSSGYIGEELVYTVYIPTEGGFRAKKVKGDVLIKYTDGTPCLITRDLYGKNTKKNHKFHPFLIDYTIFDTQTKYIIKVPRGTINGSFHLDGE